MNRADPVARGGGVQSETVMAIRSHVPGPTGLSRLANLATRIGVEPGEPLRIRAPLVALGKSGIIRRGLELGVDYSLTVSCYQADEQARACGRCDACRLRREGFAGAGVPDPTRYR